MIFHVEKNVEVRLNQFDIWWAEPGVGDGVVVFVEQLTTRLATSVVSFEYDRTIK